MHSLESMIHHHYNALRKLLLGAGIAAKESATFLKRDSNLLNLTEVVDVTNMNSPLPTTDAEMKALRSLSLIAGVRVVKLAR